MFEAEDRTQVVDGGVIQQGPLIVVVGAKGGCGATTIAANLASRLAEEQRVCLVDLHCGRGDVAAVLDVRSDRSINTVLERLSQSDDALVLGAGEVLANGLHVLAQPYDLTELQAPHADDARVLLRVVRRSFDLVFVDVGSTIQIATLATLMEATEILLVTTPDVLAVRNAQRTMRLLHVLGVAEERIRLVVNKAWAGAPLGIDDIAEQLGAPVAAVVSRDDDACAKADFEGRTLDNVAPRSRVARDLGSLWATLRELPEEKPLWSLPFSWLFGQASKG